MRAFVSSTFCDLKFERRFVIRKLKEIGIDVVSMETDFKRSFDWRQWSANLSRQCDLCICIFDKRVGTQGNVLFGDLVFHSISKIERDHAQASAFKLLKYKLERPFPDQEALFATEERDEYLETIAVEDEPGRLIHGAEIEIAFREGTLINSVAYLEWRLEVDTRISWTSYFPYKMRVLRRSYVDNNFCAWRHAYEDESYIESTTRLGLSWRLRRPAILSFIPAALLYLLPLTLAIFTSGLLAVVVGVTIIAYWPSFVWVGTKTIMARGLFGRFVQRSTDEPFQLKPHWALLDHWTGLGALSVEFADGVRVFIPLVNDPGRFVRELPTRIKERKER
jgi:hypothetical protein